MAFRVRWCGDGGRCMAVGMISGGSSLLSVGGHEGFHMFTKSSLTHEWGKDTLLLLPVSFNVELEVFN